MTFKILIVDDDYINRRLLISFLEQVLYEITILESVDGSDALEVCHKHPDIQLILLDIEMQNMDGAEFLKIFKKNQMIPTAPIITVSSNDLRKRELLELGADAFVVKPVSQSKLMDAIIYAQSIKLSDNSTP